MFCPQCGNAAAKMGGESNVLEPAQNQMTASESIAPEKPKRNAPEPRVQPSVQKVRKATSVFIEEATYDPSLRFVVVAAFLFVLFLVLLVLSKVMT
jgi:hypothetical protein